MSRSLAIGSYQNIAEPLLYHHITLPDTYSLQLLVTQVAAAQHLSGRDIGQWIFSITLEAGSPGEVADVGFPALLPFMRNLQAFSTPMDATLNVLSPMLANNSSTMRKLHVVLNGRYTSPGLRLALIGGFRSLEELAVTVEHPVAISRNSTDFLPKFDMPQLRSLTWATQSWVSKAYISLLCRSRFPILEALHLKMHVKQAFDEIIQEAIITHSTITRLGIEVNQSFRPGMLAFDITAAHVLFTGDIPPPQVINLLPRSVSAISIPMINAQRDQLLALIKALLQSRSEIGIKEVHLLANPPFSWRSTKSVTVEDQNAALYGTLLLSASQLAWRGIRILDNDGLSPEISFVN